MRPAGDRTLFALVGVVSRQDQLGLVTSVLMSEGRSDAYCSAVPQTDP